MIKIYGMGTCPDCTQVEEQVKGNAKYEKYLKEFLRLRDNNPLFDECKRTGSIGIPCFLLEDGTVTLTPEEAGLQSSTSVNEGKTCNIDGSGC